MNIYLETYGCTANKSDEATLHGILLHDGHQRVNAIEQADIIIILTCTVIDTTEQRMISRYKQLITYQKPVIVAGCMATVQQHMFTAINPSVQFLPPGQLNQITFIVESGEHPTTQSTPIFPPIIAPISIAEGCLEQCSYCITRKARGSLQSRQTDDIIKDIQCALYQGCKEIQLTAQDTATYGMDINTSLDQLLSKISTLDAKYRIRIGMMNPTHVKNNRPSFLSLFKHAQVYRFIHLPVQSGDNTILQEMNRRYTSEEFVEIITSFRKQFPDITIATDVIVGFPGETDEQFNHTIDLLNTVQPDVVNITRFSPRPNTQAKQLRNKVPTNIVKQRSQQLTHHVQHLQEKQNTQHLGQTYEVLITEPGKQHTMMGRTNTYKLIVLKESVELGSFVHVYITERTPFYLVGNLI